MELIIVAIVELATLMVTVVLPIAFDLLVLTLNLLAMLVGFIGSALGLGGPKTGTARAEVPAHVAARRAKVKRWTLRLTAGAAGLLLVLLAALAVANTFFFDSLTNWAFGQVEKRAGVSLTYEKLEGSLWTGEFRFQNLQARRTGQVQSVFDFRVDSAEVDISMSHLIRRKIVFDRLKVAGVDGSFEQLTQAAPQTTGQRKKGLKPRRTFVINNFELAGLTVDYKNQTLARPLAAELKLDHLRAEAVASRTVVADLLFRSNAAGSFDGVGFTIVNESRTDDFSRTAWRCDNMTVSALAALIGGPFEWFEHGRVDVRVDNQSREGQGTVTDWHLTFRDFQVQAPAGASPAVKLWAVPVVAHLNDHRGDLDLGFTFKLSPDDLEFASTDDLRTLVLKMIGENLQEKLADLGRELRAGAFKSLMKDKARDRLEQNRADQAQADQDQADQGQDDQAQPDQGQVDEENSPAGEKKDGRLKSFLKDRKDRKAGETSLPAE